MLNPIVTTKVKPVVDTQKIKIKRSKYTNTRSHQIKKEDSKRKRKEQRNSENSEQLTKWQ